MTDRPNHQPNDPNSATGNSTIKPMAFEPAAAVVKPRFRLSRIQLAFIGAVLCSLLILVYLFAARTLHVSSNAADTRIDIDGLSFQFGDNFLILAGEHQLQASAPGYAEQQQTITITEQPNQQLSLILLPLPGQLTITSNVAADVFIDDQLLGKTGQLLSDIEAGPHQLKLKAPRYRELSQAITIEGRLIHQQLQFELQPAWGVIEISSEPVGAELSVDDVVVGNTPASVEIDEGKHQLRLKLPGHKAWQQVLTINAGETIKLPPVQLVKADGLAQVSSQPVGASVTVDGKYQGRTPVEVALPPGRTVQLTLFKEGYAPQHRSITAQSGVEQQISINLQAEVGEIVIKATPTDAELFIDGKAVGAANQRLTLPAHSHQLRISKAGYSDYQQTILPRPGLAQSVNVTLLTAEQTRWKNTPPTITTKAGETLKLFRPAQTFTMGASRREQGRRANEVLREVKLQRAFYLATTETTNAQFRRFEKFHSSSHVNGKSLNGETQPVVSVSWQQAAKYCNWLSEQEKLPPFYQFSGDQVSGFNADSTGYRLATEAEWEWAAREQNGTMLKFAWGADMPPATGSGNYADRSASTVAATVITAYDDGFAVTAPVGKFGLNHKGLADMSGNVAEWVNDFYGVAAGLNMKTETDPLGPTKGDHHVIRGSSWAHGSITELRYSFRDYGADPRNDVGFRVARYAAAP